MRVRANSASAAKAAVEAAPHATTMEATHGTATEAALSHSTARHRHAARESAKSG